MNTERQLFETDARGWQRGVYDDITHTLRAPIVNWIFRTLMANEPAFTRYAWGQVKPVFGTRAFARLTVRFRDTVLTELEADGPLPVYRAGDVGLSPTEFAELRGQLATYDVVSARLAVLFETMDRALRDEPIGEALLDDRAATAPFPDWLDRDRGRPPTLVAPGEIDPSLDETVDTIQSFHGFDDSLPSVYRTLAAWPPFLSRLWTDIEPRLESGAFDRAVDATRSLVDDHVDELGYRPALGPDALRKAGFSEGTITDVQGLFRSFNSGPVVTVLPALPVYAASVDAEGERDVF